MRIKEDYKEILRDTVDSETWTALLAYIEFVTKNLEQDVLTSDMNQPRQLLIRRAQLEGARKLTQALQSKSVKANLKIKD